MWIRSSATGSLSLFAEEMKKQKVPHALFVEESRINIRNVGVTKTRR